MLNQLSWTTYLEIVVLLTAIYYLFILFRYYREDAKQLWKTQQTTNTDTQKVPEVLRYPHAVPTEEIHYPSLETSYDEVLDHLENKDFGEAERFMGQLKECIKNASGKPFSPAILIPQIKKLFQENPELVHSPQRPAINELIVQECESTGTALLTEDEVDQWWTD